MHARDLVELAAVVSVHGPVLVRGATQPSARGIEDYWVASKCRLDRWGRSLRRFTEQAGRKPRDRGKHATLVRGVLEEVITGEMLTRVWAAVLCLCDRCHGTDTAEPVARSVLVGHLEARHRVLTLLVRGPGLDTAAAVKLNHLRRRTERWTDLLVGHLAGLGDVRGFAVNPERARDFAEDLCYRGDSAGGRRAWPLLLASLREGFGSALQPGSPNADLNAKIASSVLSCFQPELFDSLGLLRSLWTLRLARLADDAQGMIEELLGTDRRGGSPRQTERLPRFGR